ncbi:MAG: T9SS type A sorting domain-containing protein [Bacteroidales bacterium]|nr:T9SS type A sorting domain-containing protein [Bacteroidales bacterium]
MKKIYFLFILWALIGPINISAQQWHQIYFPNKPNGTSAVFESYDKGYVLGGNFQPYSIPTNGLIIKTDINGQMLWSKTISSTNDWTRIADINPTYENGFILTGITGEQTNQHNPYVMKLNSCAELEWCRIYNTPNPNDEVGQSIWSIPGGYIALIYAYGNDPIHERVWLYRLDNEGELIWKQLYGQSSSDIKFEQGANLIVTSDYHFIISGFCYFPDQGNPSISFLRPFIIKTDSTGTLEWELPWSIINGENFYGMAYSSVLDNQGTIYTATRHIVTGGSDPGDKPCLIKTDSNGNELSYSDIFSLSKMGSSTTINWFVDSTMALSYGWTDTLTTSYDGTVGVVKCNRNGDILFDKPILTNQYLFGDGITTFDNKLLLVGGFKDGIWTTNAYKLNSNLEYDSVYNQPFVYDSICPHPIPSDTIPLGCVLVGSEEHTDQAERTEMLVYPNPVSEILHVVLPDQLKTFEKSNHFNITTFRSRWNSVELEVYNLFGKRLFSRQVPFDEKAVELNVSSWQNGMYLIRLVFNNRTVCTAKVIKK